MNGPKKSFFTMTKTQMACVPLLVVWPVVVWYVQTTYSDRFWILFGTSCLVYLCLGGLTGCVWPATLAIAGAAIGFFLDARPKGGTIESQAWELAFSVWGWAALGMFVGLIVHENDIKNPGILPRSKCQRPRQ